MSSRSAFAPRDAWEWLGIAAWLVGGLLILADLATGFDREYPGSLILLGIGGTLLLTYRSATGLFASRPPAFRRMLGLGIAAPGFFLALLEVLA
jgi:hypothetical protein